jgi:glycosyltransferase involved in cell wall biosynthesis/GT2 family glycosyltransferase
MLAEALADAGHDVTILYTLGAHCENGTIEEWIAHYRARGIVFVPMPDMNAAEVFLGPHASYAAYRWLASKDFDCIHFPEWGGVGFSAAQAKSLGLAFERTVLCAGIHSPSLWHDLGDHRPIHRHDQLELDYREQRSVELADVVVAPSQYILRWVSDRGWCLPARTHVWPYIAPQVPPVPVPGAGTVREVVFFGRLEARKGLKVFCDALDRLEGRTEAKDVRVTFLGKGGFVDAEDGLSYLARRALGWRRPYDIRSDFSRSEALEYLVSHAALAVMPSVADNTPNTVIECMAAGIPFLAANAGGIPEMIHERDRAGVLFAGGADALAVAIVDCVTRGARTARPARDPREIRTRWTAWHARLADDKPTAAADSSPARPLVTICMATRNRPHLLEQALASIRRQTYPNIELVLVDDGSDESGAREALERLRAEFTSRRWTLLSEPRRFPGPARNVAACHAHGRYLLFMDDDNVARPDEVEVLVRAAEHSGAAILTCANDRFKGQEPPGPGNRLAERWMPIGPALPLALFINCVGDTNMLVRREAFFSAGRFDEEPGVGVEDWTFLINAVLRGLRVEAVPEVLYDYRVSAEAFGQQFHPLERRLRAMRPVIELLPPGIGLGLVYASSVAGSIGEVESTRPVVPTRGSRVRARVHGWLVRWLRPHSRGSDQGQHLAQRFQQAEAVASYGPGGRQLIPLGQVTLATAGDAVTIRSFGNEPRLALDGPPVQRGPLVLRLEVSTPMTGMAQIFWKTVKVPFYCEEQSVRVPVTRGRNTCYVRIPAAAVIGPLRLDPLTRSGEITLHALDVRRDAS